MNKNKPLILVVNDDGIDSQGINFLKKIMYQIGDVYVVAPDSNRSAYSHSMTLNDSISIKQLNINLNEFSCSGTPVDCVKLALNKILPRTPDLCVSGINHGSNQSINGLYSGTLHAAMEANIHGVPAISFSHLSYNHIINFTPFTSFIYNISSKVLVDSAEGVTLNINFPDGFRTRYISFKAFWLSGIEHKLNVVTAVSIELSSNGNSSADAIIKLTSRLYLLALSLANLFNSFEGSTPYIFVTLLES